jgi:hypothetical protein
MVDPDERDLYETTIEAYFDLVRYAEKSEYFHEAFICLEILEHFEEFEKCETLLKKFPDLKIK